MSQRVYCTTLEIEAIFGISYTDTRRVLRELGLLGEGREPTVRAIRGGFCKRQWRNTHEYRWVWHRERIIRAFKKAGFQPVRRGGLLKRLASKVTPWTEPAPPPVKRGPVVATGKGQAEKQPLSGPDVDTLLEHAEDPPAKADTKLYGRLIPVGGGEAVAMHREVVLVGRRDTCDIVIGHSDVSSHHCELSFANGAWFVKDLHSTNGVSINGVRIESGSKKQLKSGTVLSFASHSFKIDYGRQRSSDDEPEGGDTIMLSKEKLLQEVSKYLSSGDG